LTIRKYLVILRIVLFGSVRDAFLARGKKRAGSIDIHHAAKVLSALANPFVIFGIFSVLAFMSTYMTALSFADLSYVLPATAISYVVMVLLSIVWLHEHVSSRRGAGVAFISNLVGLSWADLSLIGPATAALTFVSNAIAAKFFLHENVDRRRWFATIFVCCGVLLLT
jgi:drug/metabolite transporter (DMT)-like permease